MVFACRNVLDTGMWIQVPREPWPRREAPSLKAEGQVFSAGEKYHENTGEDPWGMGKPGSTFSGKEHFSPGWISSPSTWHIERNMRLRQLLPLGLRRYVCNVGRVTPENP